MTMTTDAILDASNAIARALRRKLDARARANLSAALDFLNEALGRAKEDERLLSRYYERSYESGCAVEGQVSREPSDAAVIYAVSEAERAGVDIRPILDETQRRVSREPKERCGKCRGAGWAYGCELDVADEATIEDTMTHYTCDWCGGTGKRASREPKEPT